MNPPMISCKIVSLWHTGMLGRKRPGSPYFTLTTPARSAEDRHAPTSQTGFSLLELLVAMMIIAVIATLGFKQYNKYSAKARYLKAQDTLRIVGDGLDQYFLKHGKYPDLTSYESMVDANSPLVKENMIPVNVPAKDPWEQSLRGQVRQGQLRAEVPGRPQRLGGPPALHACSPARCPGQSATRPRPTRPPRPPEGRRHDRSRPSCPPTGCGSTATLGSPAHGGRHALRGAAWQLLVMPSGADFFMEVKGEAVWEGACSRCLEPLDLPLAVESQFLGSKDPELVVRRRPRPGQPGPGRGLLPGDHPGRGGPGPGAVPAPGAHAPPVPGGLRGALPPVRQELEQGPLHLPARTAPRNPAPWPRPWSGLKLNLEDA